MATVKRYDYGDVETGIGMYPAMIERPEGAYVTYEDFNAMKIQRDALLEWKDSFLSELART